MKNDTSLQRSICDKYGSPWLPVVPDLKIGVSKEVRENIYPINGLRHRPEGNTSGWYIWAGQEIGANEDFFLPLHAEHISEWCPEVEKYLALAPGWRFLIAPDYEDVWYDPSLLID